MRVRARARDRAGPCAHAGRSGATRSGNRSSWSGTEDRFGEEDGADSGPGLSAGATRARAWERRLTHGPCWQAGERAAARAGQAAAWAVREWSVGRWLSGLMARAWVGSR